ncbi:MAG: amino acid permease [Candidatus Omnitrophica bacterium]|nr:amino acid permease [Candidatus Omnitrophota bacterium]
MEQLKRKLGLPEVFCIASGAMISSGLFILPGLAFAYAGPAVIISYLIAGLACIPTVMSMAELASAMPKAGGDYFYIARGFGPFVGTLSGFGSWFALSFKSAWALIGMGVYLSLLLPLSIQQIAVGLCAFFVVLNIIGVKEASKFQVILVAGLITILAVYIIWGGMYVEPARLTPFFSRGHLAMFATASFVFVSYGGLTKIVAVAEEIERPERNLLFSMVLSLSVVTLLYVLVVFVTVGVVDAEVLAGTLMPLSKGAETFSGKTFRNLIGLGASLAFLTTANAGIMSASRYLLGMSRDGHLPHAFQRISLRFKTPYVAIIATGVFMTLAILRLPLEMLVKMGSVIFLLLYIFTNAAVVLFRQSRIANYRPTFRSPFYPYLHIAGIVITLFLLLEVATGVLFLTMLLLCVSAIVYKFTLHKKIVRDSALEHILSRLVSADKELTGVDVSTELKEIVLSRDNLEDDTYYQKLKHEIFDEILSKSSVLDIEEKVKAEPLFRRISEVLAKEFSLDKLSLLRKFMEREETSSTVVEKGIAIPHLIIEGKNILKVLFVRAGQGAVFPDGNTAHTAIVVVSSFDRRHLHLKMLGYFVNMIEDPDFNNEWLMELKKEELTAKVFEFISMKISRKDFNPSPHPSSRGDKPARGEGDTR